MTMSEKGAISHRGIAEAKLVIFFYKYLIVSLCTLNLSKSCILIHYLSFNKLRIKIIQTNI